jgi:hypothetical protein
MAEEVRRALEWAQVRALAADGVSQREVAGRLGINRRTVARLLAADVPPRYSRAPAGSMLDPLEPVLRRLLDHWPDIKAPRVTEILDGDYGYAGSVALVRRRLARLRPRSMRAAQRTGYRPGQVLQLNWAEKAADRRARAARLRVGRDAALLGRADRTLQLRSDGRELSGGPRPGLWTGSAVWSANALGLVERQLISN